MERGRIPSGSARGKYLRGKSLSGWTAKRSMAVLAGILGLLFALSPLLGENGLPAFFGLRSERDELRREVEELRQRHRDLQGKIEALQEDPEALERLARERYNMQLPEEDVVEIVSKPTAEQAP